MRWPVERKPQYRLTYESEPGLYAEARLRASLDGVRWDRADLPPRVHHCWAQTRIASRGSLSYRCACGAWSPDGVMWLNRNSRRPTPWPIRLWRRLSQ